MTWESQGLWKKDEHESKGKRSSKGRTIPQKTTGPPSSGGYA